MRKPVGWVELGSTDHDSGAGYPNVHACFARSPYSALSAQRLEFTSGAP
jgi:hypothetical protein